MKKCRILHINDNMPDLLTKNDKAFSNPFIHNMYSYLIEHFPKMEEAINKLMQMGYEVKQMVPQYSPSVQGDHYCLTFYLSGYTFYLEKDFKEGENDDEEVNDLLKEIYPAQEPDPNDLFYDEEFDYSLDDDDDDDDDDNIF